MPFIGIALDIVLDFMKSRAGQLLLAFSVAWVWSWSRTDNIWRARFAAEKAQIERMYQIEAARQEQAAKDIASAATERVSEEIELNSSLQAIIAGFENDEKKLKAGVPCVIDGNFSGVVRKLSTSSGASKSSSSSGKLRKAR